MILLTHHLFHSRYKLFPILVNSVSFPDPKLKLSAIDTFLLILTESPSVIEEHISTVIPVLVGLADFTKLDLGNTLVKEKK